jgi:hypothetical protein
VALLRSLVEVGLGSALLFVQSSLHADDRVEHSFANLSLYAPTALYSDAEQRSFNLEIGLVYSKIGSFDGIALNPGYLWVKGTGRGLFVAPVFGRIEGFSGLQIFTFGWSTRTRGVQLALWGGSSELDGLGFSIVFYAKRLEGVRIVGVLNVLDDQLFGAQLSAGFNLGGGKATGVEIAGLANWTEAAVDGLQLAGGLNVAHDLRGVQIGVVNVAGSVDGVQLGVVNVADEVRGVSLGLVPIARYAEYAPRLSWATGDTRGRRRQLSPFVGMKTLFRPFYGLIEVGALGRGAEAFDRAAAQSMSEPKAIAAGIGAGARFGTSPFIDLETLYTFESGPQVPAHVLTYRTAFGLQFGPIGGFVGSGARQQMSADGVTFLPHLFAGCELLIRGRRKPAEREP